MELSFAVNMLAATKAGNCYTFNEVKEGRNYGFHDIKMIRGGARMDQIVAKRGLKPIGWQYQLK